MRNTQLMDLKLSSEPNSNDHLSYLRIKKNFNYVYAYVGLCALV